MRDEIANELGYLPQGDIEITHSLFSGLKTKTQKHNVFLVRVKSLDESYACNFSVLGQKTICDTIPCLQPGTWIKDLQKNKITLSDVGNDDSVIDLLIGGDIASKLLTGKKQDLSNGLTAFETVLGWTIMGKLNNDEKHDFNNFIVASMITHEARVADLWNLDLLGIKDPIEQSAQSEINLKTFEFLKNTCVITSEKRFEIKLPWTRDHPLLPDYYELAFRRLNSTVEKLNKQELISSYNSVFDEWLLAGIIERVPINKIKISNCSYLPHRPVIKLHGTTKIRPVFDASAKLKGFVSLNHCLEKGPNLLELIPSCLNRFRERKIGVISDIAKAFLQISISKEDRDFLRFLWYHNGQLIIYRNCRVVFGLSCSPFILAACITLLLESALKQSMMQGFSDWSEETVRKLKESFYVDNCVTSVESNEELSNFIKQSKSIMSKGGFDLRGWEHSGDRETPGKTF